MHTTKNEQHKNKETTTNNKQQKNPQLLQQQCSNITEATKSNDNEDNKIHSKETTTTNKNGQNKQQTQLVVLKPPSITCSPLVRTTRKKKEIITDNRTPKISKYFSAMPKPTVDSSIKHQNDTIEDVAEVNDASTEPEHSTSVQCQPADRTIAEPVQEKQTERSCIENISTLNRIPDLELSQNEISLSNNVLLTLGPDESIS